MMPLMKVIRQKHQSISDRVSQLSKETQSFLSSRASQRQSLAQQQANELSEFRQNLFNSVWGKSGINKNKKLAKSTLPLNQNLQSETAVPSEAPDHSLAGATLPAETLKGQAIDILSAELINLQDEPTVLEIRQEASVPYEQEVYAYLQQGNNAGLTNIQKALGIKHYEAANALRSLVQKGLLSKI